MSALSRPPVPALRAARERYVYHGWWRKKGEIEKPVELAARKGRRRRTNMNKLLQKGNGLGKGKKKKKAALLPLTVVYWPGWPDSRSLALGVERERAQKSKRIEGELIVYRCTTTRESPRVCSAGKLKIDKANSLSLCSLPDMEGARGTVKEIPRIFPIPGKH